MTNLTTYQIQDNWIVALLAIIGLSAVWLYLNAGKRFKARKVVSGKVATFFANGGPIISTAQVSGLAIGKEAVAPRLGWYSALPGKTFQKAKRHRRQSVENLLSMTAIAGDFAMIGLGFALAVLLAQASPVQVGPQNH